MKCLPKELLKLPRIGFSNLDQFFSPAMTLALSLIKQPHFLTLTFPPNIRKLRTSTLFLLNLSLLHVVWLAQLLEQPRYRDSRNF